MSEPLSAFRALWKPTDPGFIQDLGPLERSVLSVLLVHQGREGVSWPSHQTIVKATGLGRSTAIRVLGELEERGLVSRSVNPPAPTRYTVSLRDRPGAGPSRSETETVPERDRDRPGAGHELPYELPYELSEEGADGGLAPSDEIPPPGDLPRANGRFVYPPEFETAWEVFPPRAGSNPKKGAYRAWRARVTEGSDPEELLEGVRRYARFVKATGKGSTEFVLQAATFFGPDERWREPWKPPRGSAESEPPTRILR